MEFIIMEEIKTGDFKLLDPKYTAWNTWIIEKQALGKLPLLVNPKLSDKNLDKLNCNINRPLKKKETKMVKIEWENEKVENDVLYFDDLDYESFRIKGCNAVYLKVHIDVKYQSSSRFYSLCEYPDWMLEIATGNLFIPTKSPIERVESKISVNLAKPSIYD
jgi:hypothetical protein